MIHVILGTKAQMVKMSPLLAHMGKMGIDYNFIFTGQHQETVDDIRNNFSVKEPDYILHKGKDVSSIFYMVFWALKIVLHTVINRKKVFCGDSDGIVLVHGDTFSTLVGAILGKLFGFKVGHIESGLRSHELFHPFPEELTRILVFKLSDYYFCPGQWACQNLKGYPGNVVDTRFNTLIDAVRHVWADDVADVVPPIFEKYSLISTHRFENWASRKAALVNVELIERIVETVPGLFVAHSITKKKLHEYGLYDRLAMNKNIEIRERCDFRQFIKLVKGSEFVVTDGGSNQEECSYIGKPCLLLRKASERQEGLGENAVLSKYDVNVVDSFLSNYESYKRPIKLADISPSEIIVEHIRIFV